MVSACGHVNVMLTKVVSRFLFYQMRNTYYFHIAVVGRRHCCLLEEAAPHVHDVADYYPNLQRVGCSCNHFDKLEGGGMSVH